jgi:hypothetical protein
LCLCTAIGKQPLRSLEDAFPRDIGWSRHSAQAPFSNFSLNKGFTMTRQPPGEVFINCCALVSRSETVGITARSTVTRPSPMRLGFPLHEVALQFRRGSRFASGTMANEENNDVRRAEEHVAEGRRIVQMQKGLIIRLRAAGVDTWDAERTLGLFESNLKRFEEHRDFLKRKSRGFT